MDVWEDAELVHRYGIEQAVADGVLIHPYEGRWPWLLITPAIRHACENQEGRSYDQCLIPFLHDCILQARLNQDATNFWKLEHTIAGEVWIMKNEKGGLTVMTPEEY